MLAMGTTIDEERGQAHDNDSATPLHGASSQLQWTSDVCWEDHRLYKDQEVYKTWKGARYSEGGKELAFMANEQREGLYISELAWTKANKQDWR